MMKIEKPYQVWEVLPWGTIGDAIGAYASEEEAEAKIKEYTGLDTTRVYIWVDQRRIHNFWKLNLGSSTYAKLRDKS